MGCPPFAIFACPGSPTNGLAVVLDMGYAREFLQKKHFEE
jgi:hypothetical protein